MATSASRHRARDTSSTPARAERFHIAAQMRRVSALLKHADRTLDTETVHDLRVAMRRCRSVADLMADVDPHPSWSAVKRLSRRLFKRLGVLRDSHVLRERLAAADSEDGLPSSLITTLDRREARASRRARRALDRFDRKAWKHLIAELDRRARAVPSGGLAAQRLVRQRWDAVSARHAAAMRTRDPETWHALRIAVKRFRYAVESAWPGRLRQWDEGLRDIQDVLGWIHDLDVFDAFVTAEAPASSRRTSALRRSARREQATHRVRYRALMRGRSGLLATWRAGLRQRRDR
jgi:CHAD domain-containing protein